jgi:hypothetical protein
MENRMRRQTILTALERLKAFSPVAVLSGSSPGQ